MPNVIYGIGMYSGLLPNGVTEDDLSPDDEEDKQEDLVEEDKQGENTGSPGVSQSTQAADSDSPTCSMPGVSQEMWQVCCIY